MDTPNTCRDGVEHHLYALMHKLAETELWRHKVRLEAIRDPDNLHLSYTLLKPRPLTKLALPCAASLPRLSVRASGRFEG